MQFGFGKVIGQDHSVKVSGQDHSVKVSGQDHSGTKMCFPLITEMPNLPILS